MSNDDAPPQALDVRTTPSPCDPFGSLSRHPRRTVFALVLSICGAVVDLDAVPLRNLVHPN